MKNLKEYLFDRRCDNVFLTEAASIIGEEMINEAFKAKILSKLAATVKEYEKEHRADDVKKQKEYVSKISNINSRQRLRDRHENVWLVCKECQDIKPLFEFEKINDEAPIECEKYNYPGKPQMGYCKKCFNK